MKEKQVWYFGAEDLRNTTYEECLGIQSQEIEFGVSVPSPGSLVLGTLGLCGHVRGMKCPSRNSGRGGGTEIRTQDAQGHCLLPALRPLARHTGHIRSPVDQEFNALLGGDHALRGCHRGQVSEPGGARSQTGTGRSRQ